MNVFDAQPVRPDRRRLAQLFATACCADDMMQTDFDGATIANPDNTISKAEALDMLRLASPGSTMEQIEAQVEQNGGQVGVDKTFLDGKICG